MVDRGWECFTFRLEVWGLGDIPHKPFPAEAMTHPNPRSCVLAGGGVPPFQLSKPERGMTRQGRTQAPSSSNRRPQHWRSCPGHSPRPHPRAVEVSPPPWSSAMDGALPHQAGWRQSQKQWWWRGKEQAPRRAAPGPRALLKPGQAVCPCSSGTGH